MKYSSEKCACFVDCAWMCSYWEKCVAHYLLYELNYGDLNACMAVVYDF